MTDGSLIRRYDDAAPNWGGKVDALGYQRAYGDFVRQQLLPLNSGSLVCDIGTGSGTFALAALAGGPLPANLTLIDPAAKMLRHACETLAPLANDITCIQTTLEQYQTDQRYDLVLGAHVIEHCPDPVRALQKLYRLLAPGGLLLLVISRPHWCQWLIWLRWRHRWYSETQVGAMAERGGLPVPECHRFTAGPPKRTSFGYKIKRPSERI